MLFKLDSEVIGKLKEVHHTVADVEILGTSFLTDIALGNLIHKSRHDLLEVSFIEFLGCIRGFDVSKLAAIAKDQHLFSAQNSGHRLSDGHL